ncbi:helix-turn-helix transcriptional regulator [Nocardiopsis sp. CNT312]|uniref:helix-turn-helix domain-containing protein n=1 Tax=Nocardiopsis sp. CNT312 TaxID=1137268 RepID=UPI00048C8692|nr:helix-turn-helix transcriptional regulator [Nocardiopsis sp. CNT312]
MEAQQSPAAARRKLGAHLRRLRSAAKLTGARVAADIGCAPSTISKFEGGSLIPDTEQLDQLLALFNVQDADEAHSLHRLLEAASESGWWEAYDDVLPPRFDTYIGLELDAASVQAYETTLIHGLLETREYASALLHGASFGTPPEDIDLLVDVRMRRKELFDRDPALRLSVVMEEAALLRPIGGTEVMRDQIQHLIEEQSRPHINIQVLPFSLGAHVGLNGNMALLEFEDQPPVVHAEGSTGNSFLLKPREVRRCKLLLKRLHEIALSASETTRYLTTTLKELK